MAAKALARFGFAKPELETILFLIHNHLAMSSVFLRRDLEQTHVIQEFAKQIKSVDRLCYLCLLTFADIKAVAPNTLTQWKKDLLWKLYVATYHTLTLDYGKGRIKEGDIGQELLDRLPANFDRKAFKQFLDSFPTRYLTSVRNQEIYHHYRLAHQLRPEGQIQFRLTHQGTHHELSVVTPETSHLFAKIVGLLSYFNMDILKGYGFSNQQSTVLDFFQFSESSGDLSS